MELVDPSGNEITSKENEQANKLEEALGKKAEKVIEPVLNRIKLSGSQIPQQQLMQLVSMAHSQLFNRMIYNLLVKLGYDSIDDLLTDDDIEEMQKNLKNQVKMVDANEMAQQQQAAQNPKSDDS